MFSWEWLWTQLKDVTMLSTFVRLFLAVIFGGTIGMERRYRGRAAGMRTHALVCMGASLVMLTNQYIFSAFGASDPTRLGAQVISGIGFLGVGTIVVDRHRQVRGLTTAAGLWSCACMGLALGIGFYEAAVCTWLLILLTVSALNKLEMTVLGKSRRMVVYAEFQMYSDINEFVALAGTQEITVTRLELVQPHGYSDDPDIRSAAIITLLLPKEHSHAEVIKRLGASMGLIALEEV
ncbi:MAG: MgtC/SapB family protein [Candidatus Limiplasma sp.]|nr:MgtC/SapB family protein [Candidatus Limiplasma sp.]